MSTVASPKLKGMVAQKLSIACAMVLAGCVLGSDVASSFHSKPETCVAIAIPQPESASLECPAGVLEALARLHMVLDEAHDLLMTHSVPKEMLLEHPFGTIYDVLDRALKELRPLRGTGQLDQEGEKFVIAIAEARSKAGRNVRLIQQFAHPPKTYRSRIDRVGLVAMAGRAREVALGFHA